MSLTLPRALIPRSTSKDATTNTVHTVATAHVGVCSNDFCSSVDDIAPEARSPLHLPPALSPLASPSQPACTLGHYQLILLSPAISPAPHSPHRSHKADSRSISFILPPSSPQQHQILTRRHKPHLTQGSTTKIITLAESTEIADRTA